MERIVKFKLLTQIQLERLETDAVTFGELKEDIASSHLSDKIDFGVTTLHEGGNTYEESIKLIEKNTFAEYGALDDAKLPVGECFFYVTPTKTKSGWSGKYPLYTENELNELGYNELRSLGSALNKEENAGIDLSGKREDILFRVELFFDDIATELAEHQDEIMQESVPIASFKERLFEISEELRLLAETMKEISFVDGVTHEEVHEEALKLKALLSKEH